MSACNGLGNIAALYNSTFSNVDATIYVKMGATGLGESTYFINPVTYSAYRSALESTGIGNTIDTEALTSLPSSEPSIYSGGSIELTSALVAALKISAFTSGFTSSGSTCSNPGTSGCFDGVITVSNSATLYYRSGQQAGNAYDFFSVVEHETDEVLGTSSCLDVASGSSVTDGCGGTNISAVDLFRYYGTGTRAFESTTAGAYFSYNGGATNGAQGATYNTSTAGEDYADFTQSCEFIQDATGCPGQSIDITNDGTGGGKGPEITILDAVGYNQNTAPEPGTFGLLTLGAAAIVGRMRFRRR